MSFIEDELEVEQIMGNVISYFIKIGFDELTMATHDATESAKSLSKTLNESEYFTRFIQAGKQIDMEAGAYNQAIRRSLNEAK